MKGLPARPFRALALFPGLRHWLEAAIALLAFAAVFAPLGVSTGLIVWKPMPAMEIGKVLLTALLVPALGEEFVFRGFVPTRGESRRPILWIAATTFLFALWHWAETLYMPAMAAIFLRPDFLAQATSLGLICAILRHRSGSLWPPVVFHWVVAGGWLAFLSGPVLR